MKIKTSELTGAALDWAIAKCTPGVSVFVGFNHTLSGPQVREMGVDDEPPYSPSTNWALGGPIIDRAKMKTEFVPTIGWRAALEFLDEPQAEIVGAPTALIAAMRCFVASKLGNEVDVPEELL